MNTNLSNILLKDPREKDGARTLSRYGFQIHTSLSKILKLHKNGIKFRALFDHFDDLVIIEDPDEEFTVRSYQIKGKASGTWTAATLSKCKTKGNAVTSIIGKMYQLTEVFETNLTSTHFLTNAPYSIKLNDNKKTTVDNERIECSQLHLVEKDKISATLCCNFPLPRVPSEDDIVIFETTDVPLKNYDVVLKGQLVEVLLNETPSNVTGVYNALVAEVLMKSKNTTKPGSVNELFDLKSLSSGKLEDTLNLANVRTNILDCWEEVSADFGDNGFSSVDRIKLKSAVVQYLRKRSIGTSSIESINLSIEGALKIDPSMGIAVHNFFSNPTKMKDMIIASSTSKHDEMFVLAACLVTIFENL